jgi:SAM-dependent methyltransferase
MLSLSDRPAVVLAEARRVLAPGGCLVLADVYARAGPEEIEPEDPSRDGWPVNTCLAGAVSRSRIEHRVARAGFTQVLWEDHTPYLKRLAAQLVFAFGSMNAFWEAMGGCGRESGPRPPGAPRLPGYYLLVARREEKEWMIPRSE